MQDKKRVRIILLLASAAALATIVAGALFLIAPVFQPFYHTAEYTPPVYSSDTKEEQVHPGSGEIIDLNTATAAELTALDGIGEAKAEAIVQYRSAHGSFATPEDVTRVSGISQSMVDSWAGQICIGTPETAQK